jgi:hypothetical protein
VIALDFNRRALDCAAGTQPSFQSLEQRLPIFYWNQETLDYCDGLPAPPLPVEPDNHLLLRRIQRRLDAIFDRSFLPGNKLAGGVDYFRFFFRPSPFQPRDGCGGLLLGLPFVPQIQSFNFISGPWGPSQKLQAGFDTWVIIKTPDADDSSHFLPAMKFSQPGQNHFQSDAVKRIVGLSLSHVSARLIDYFCFQ